ncbi:RNA pseudouridine synthase [Candidatus Vidania fulgoroideae]|uniref:RNA pseudouridine synthase n=1 Tax=Candidatus Vidania fulgoroideorum TaxID=881286 RepID=A0AAX3N9T7_9PROT|nr:RNA pseudouridine synthase [Candidatus Vidania fulgoroideae]WDR79371.1 RNA pseudouridine synthase [Candidatus Vidania fulgoroideae]
MSIIYEDNNLLIVKKPYNICVHKNKNFERNILDMYSKKKKLHIINRLDKDVSGIVIFSKEKNNNIIFFKKLYISLVIGKIYLSKINLPIKKNKFFMNFLTKIDINGKQSLTYIKLIKFFKILSILKIEIFTGRTHQIRQHLSYIGCPILGDKKYGNFYLNKKIYNKNIFLFFKETIFYDVKRKKLFNIVLKTPKKFIKYGCS